MTNTDYIDYMDLNTIRKAWDEGAYHCNLTVPQKVGPNHVFDENLSVKRNREMVEKHNANVERLKEDKWRRQSEYSPMFILRSIVLWEIISLLLTILQIWYEMCLTQSKCVI